MTRDVPDRGARSRPIRRLPSARSHDEEIRGRLGERTPALFLDYDGTLTPIVADPADATLPPETRGVLRRLSDLCPVAVVSGRDLADVFGMVGLPDLFYAGSHGFDIRGPDGLREERAPGYLPDLDAAAERLRNAVEGIPGARVERKRFAVAVHYRATPRDRVSGVEEAVGRVAADTERLRLSGGKEIFELRPAVEWDKGRALLWLMDVLELDRDRWCPVYIGDDVTDEDAFRVVRDDGVALVVRGEEDDRPTRAHYALEDPDDVRAFLETLADWMAFRHG